MDNILTAVAALAIMVATGVIATAAMALRPTTLLVAWRWAMGAVLIWLITLGGSLLNPGVDEIDELMWYSVVLLSLCPAIAVLGARRPGAAAWTWFVMLPMLAVLGWPMLTVWGSDLRAGSFQLEVPQLIGFVLILLMGAGNYVGTKFWASACLYAVALCLLVAPLSTVAPEGLQTGLARQMAGLALGGAAMMARVQSRNRLSTLSPIDQLWDDYRNMFGIVWGNRLQERLNGVARQQAWPLEVTPMGIVWQESLTDEQRQETAAKLEQTLRWLLRRFVDPTWIDERLKTSSSPET